MVDICMRLPELMGSSHARMLGAQCALLPELFGNRHRDIGVMVSREFSAVIAGGIAPCWVFGFCP